MARLMTARERREMTEASCRAKQAQDEQEAVRAKAREALYAWLGELEPELAKALSEQPRAVSQIIDAVATRPRAGGR